MEAGTDAEEGSSLLGPSSSSTSSAASTSSASPYPGPSFLSMTTSASPSRTAVLAAGLLLAGVAATAAVAFSGRGTSGVSRATSFAAPPVTAAAASAASGAAFDATATLDSSSSSSSAPEQPGIMTPDFIQARLASWGLATTKAGLADAVLSMPGYTADASSPEIFQFAGYVDVSSTKRSFYLLTLSQRDPATDPLVLWTNGGPGCSGLIGYMTEHGPFRPLEDLTLELNDFSWTKVANMLYIESPTGVGYSYSRTDLASDLLSGDRSVARDNLELIKQVLAKHPGFASHSFYLSAESYGGHYIPTLAEQLVAAEAQAGINFKGFIVGNPYTDPVENMRGMFGAFWGHQMVPAPVYSAWLDACGDKNAVSFYYDDEDCVKYEDYMADVIGDVDWYGLDFPVCNRVLDDSGAQADAEKVPVALLGQVLSTQALRLLEYAHPRLHARLTSAASVRHAAMKEFAKDTVKGLSRELNGGVGAMGGRRLLTSGSPGKALGYDACVADYATQYLNKAEVKAALHAKEDIEWQECSSSITYAFKDEMDYMEPIYKQLIDEHDLRILVYSGDDDSICAPLGTQNWVWKLGYPVKKDWAAWYFKDPEYGPGQVGGYHVSFKRSTEEEEDEDGEKDNGGDGAALTFVTVHHAGHEVPMYQPMRALHVFSNFIDEVW